MDWALQVNLTAGLGTLILGAGVLAREPSRPRNRHFALLCLALSLWTLGSAAEVVFSESRFPWHIVLLSGSCAAGPLALHLAFVLAREHGRFRRLALRVAYVAAALLWLSSWTPIATRGGPWPIVALVVLGAILLLALGVLLRATLAMRRGPERRAFLLLLVAGSVAVGGGLSDFLPRGNPAIPSLGPAATLVFLVIVCGLVVRHRFMDVDVFLTRAVILIAGAAAGGLVIFGVARLTGARFLPITFATLVVLLAAATLGRAVMSGARSVLSTRDPVAQALREVSRLLPRATDVGGIWDAIRAGRDALPGDVRVEIFWRTGEEYTLRFRAGDGGDAAPVATDAPLVRLLSSERQPLTRAYLAREQQEARGAGRETTRAALDYLETTKAELVVPLERDGALRGWLAIGGAFPERYLTAEIATAFEAVANQAVASTERIEAIEAAKRREALAAIGELAGGLAHEVRNPVAAIRGAAQALGPAATPDQAREMLQVIDEESERLGRFVGEFLEYAKPASPRRDPVPLAPLVRRTLQSWTAAAGRPIDATIEAEPGLPAARGDADQIRRVFENLVRNATEAAGPEVKLLIGLRRDGDGRIRARFEDNGPGIPHERIPELFQPFRTTKPGGAGLGLAIVHRIVDSHGGEVRVDGRPGRGAVFTIVLPCVETEG
jgi:two-component system, NtrC family, sensor histidine kinase HydH